MKKNDQFVAKYIYICRAIFRRSRLFD